MTDYHESPEANKMMREEMAKENTPKVHITEGITVLYHHDTDGFCAAWIASKYLPPNTNFHPVDYTDKNPPWGLINGHEVYILDFSYKRETMETIRKSATFLTCLDHHKTAAEELKDLPGCVFDMNRSGAMLTLDHFRNTTLATGGKWKEEAYKQMVSIVQYVQDRDLWRFLLPQSKQINLAIQAYPLNFEAWDAMVFKAGVNSLEIQGHAILSFQNRKIAGILRNARTVVLDGHKVWAVNSAVFHSELAGFLAEKPVGIEVIKEKPEFGMTWNQEADGRIHVELRSRHGFDVSRVAKKFGGGGHKAAAGFVTDSKALKAYLIGIEIPD